MKKVITPVVAVALSFGLSQVTIAKEHHGPNKPQAQKHRTYKNDKANYRSTQKHRPAERARAHNSRSQARTHDAYRDNRRHNSQRRVEQKHRYDRHDNRYDRRYDRRHGHRHSDRYGHDRHYRDYYKPRHRNYYSYNNYYPRYNYYPTSVYYLGQDWYYYGNSYHPFPRGHVHSRRCHHRFWEPLAAGIILGSVLGW